MPEFDGYPTPIATVDVALFTLIQNQLYVLLPERESEPYLGERALPGGFVFINVDSTTMDTAKRVLLTKVSLKSGYFIEQLYTFSGVKRDPRGWSLSVAYFAVVPVTAINPKYVEKMVLANELPPLSFDHNHIIKKALERLQNKSSYSSLPAFLLNKEFTFAELHGVYQCIMGEKLDKSSFRRKIEQFIEPVEGVMRQEGPHRPSQVYKRSNRALSEFEGRI